MRATANLSAGDRSILAGTGLFDGIGPAEFARLAALSEALIVPLHQHVFEENEPARGLWVVAVGRVRLEHTSASGRVRVVGFAGPGSALDLPSAFDGRRHMTTALALDDCRLVLVPRQPLSSVVASHPALLANLVGELCREIRRRDIDLAVAAFQDARGRMSCALLQLAREYGVPADGVVQIGFRLTRRDLADRAGVTIETAIRVMSELQRRKVVATDAQRIAITDLAGLRRMAGCNDCLLQCAVFAARPSAAAAAVPSSNGNGSSCTAMAGREFSPSVTAGNSHVRSVG